jgi:hypothetical protein
MHRMPAHYFCLSIECESNDLLCFLCLKKHEGHKDHFKKIDYIKLKFNSKHKL